MLRTTFLLCLLWASIFYGYNAYGQHRFSIRFDYRFDGGYFSEHPDRRAALEAAADIWSGIIGNDFEEVPAGSTWSVYNYQAGSYEAITLEQPIDDLLIFVFAQAFETPSTKATGGHFGSWETGDAYDRRYNGLPFQPWLGSLCINTQASRPWFFDPTPETADDLPGQTHYDFISTALHEIGHILGFMHSSLSPLKKGDLFYGEQAMAANGGKPVRFDEASGHLHPDMAQYGLRRPRLETQLMSAAAFIYDFRYLPTRLDLAILRDLGYTINDTHVPPLYDDPDEQYSKRARWSAVDARAQQFPKGLWEFEEAGDIHNAVIGTPLKYMPATVPVVHRLEGGGVWVPKGDYWVAGHTSQQEQVDHYTLLFDLYFPNQTEWYALYNTNIENTNHAEAFVKGSIGQGNYSDRVIPAREWVRIVLTVDATNDQRRYYCNGGLWLEQSGGADSRFAIYGKEQPLFLLFGDNEGNDGALLVRRVAFFDYVLSGEQIALLASPDKALEVVIQSAGF